MINIIDLHNDPEFALKNLEREGDDKYISVNSSLEEMMNKMTEEQKERWEKVKYKVQIMPDFF